MKTLFAHGLLLLVLGAATAQMPGLSVSISVDQRVYAVGEPVRLHVTLRNTGPDALLGHFNLSSRAPFVRPQYRRDGAPEWSSFATEAALHPGDVWYGIRTLTPGDERRGDVVMWCNGLDTTFPFAAPARYELRVVYDDERARSGTQVVSEPVVIDVKPSQEDAAALKAFLDPKLARLVQMEERSLTPTDEYELEIRTAVRFLEQFPASRFAPYLREGVTKTLADRVREGRETALERRLFELAIGDAKGDAER
jgi:hypothetical protein